MAKLRNLRALDLHGALNNGAMLSRFESTALARMKPLPKVLSELIGLTHLNLDRCGVTSIEAPRPLKELVSLSSNYAAIASCADIAELSLLEDLTLANCAFVTDFSPLASLKKLRRLDISRVETESLDFLTSLPALKHLNVKSIKCKNLSPIYDLTLDNLEANDDVVERWRNSAELRQLPKPDDIKERLGAEDLGTVEAALLDLAKYVAASSSDDANALDGVFGLDSAHETQMREIPLLDAVITKHLTALKSTTLSALFGVTLRRIEDNYEAARIAVEEIARRKDEAAEHAVVESFKKACQYYDAGHRSQDDTNHDQLIDVYFRDFEASALAELLAWCESDHLNGDGGDDMASLFAPAFSRVRDDATFERLTSRLEQHANDLLGYGHAEPIDDLFASIEGDLEPSHRAAFTKFRSRVDETLSALRSRAEISADAASHDSTRIEKAIDRIDTLTIEDWKEVHYKFWHGLGTPGVARTSRVRLLEKFFETKDDSGVVYALVNLICEDADGTRELLAKKNIAKEDLAKHLRAVLLDVAKPAQRGEEPKSAFPAEFVRAWAEALDGISAANWRRSEIVAMFQASFQNHDEAQLAAAVSALAELPDAIDMTVPDKNYGGTIGDRLADLVGQMVKHADKTMLALARQFHKIDLDAKTRERILAQLVGLSAARDDHEAFDALSKLLPPEITNPVLAYNLACASARRNDREAVLRHVKRALDLGKSPTQIRDDSDFAPFLADPELNALLDASL